MPFLLALLLPACASGPDYVRPAITLPAEFKEWKLATPRDQEPPAKWWQAFKDPELDALQEQAQTGNQNLALAEARFRQAQGALEASRAALWPTLSANPSLTRSAQGAAAAGDSFSLPLVAAWEADLWGRLKRTAEAGLANQQASAADLAATRLSIQAALAQTWFQLRAAETQQALVARALADYQKSLALTQNQYAAGTVPKGNVILAQTQLKATEAQALELALTRAQLEHALATLLGKPASAFSVAPGRQAAAVPALPPGLPSTLLERRPDIAAAERRVAAANAQIGVAQAALYPQLTLSGSAGFRGGGLSDVLSLPNRFWSLGPSLAHSLFDAGGRRAQTGQALAGYDATVAAYRQTVLTGFQEVEDSLASLRILEAAAKVQDEAVGLARQSVQFAVNQYKAGLVGYQNVIAAQQTALGSERTAADILARRLGASVALVKALGGGWQGAREERKEERREEGRDAGRDLGRDAGRGVGRVAESDNGQK